MSRIGIVEHRHVGTPYSDAPFSIVIAANRWGLGIVVHTWGLRLIVLAWHVCLHVRGPE